MLAQTGVPVKRTTGREDEEKDAFVGESGLEFTEELLWYNDRAFAPPLKAAQVTDEAVEAEFSSTAMTKFPPV